MRPVYLDPTPVDLDVAAQRTLALDGALMAWSWLADEVAHGDGPLAGWPVGIKDLLDVAGMPTTCGAENDVPVPPAALDASCVARIRAAGGAIIGKTRAVEYGYFGVVYSRNPWNTTRSPGGSSSGSAVAVAAGMCRAAVGTQTAGSVIRPAAYSGVIGLKLSHGAVSPDGLVPVSPTLDSIGTFARTVADAAALAAVLTDSLVVGRRPERVRLGVIDDYLGPATDHAVREATETALSRLGDHGVELVRTQLALDWAELSAAHRTIMLVEMAESRRDAFLDNPSQFSAPLQEAVRIGRALSPEEYEYARRIRAAAIERICDAQGTVDAWVTPAATSVAPPAGLPGDPACSVPFTLLGCPALALPAGLTADRLPIGLQLVTAPGSDGQLVDVGQVAEAALEPLTRLAPATEIRSS